MCRGAALALVLYLVLLGIGSDQHAHICGAGTFWNIVLLFTFYGFILIGIAAAIFGIVLMFIPERFRGAPGMWYGLIAVSVLVFAGTYVHSLGSAVHIGPNDAVPKECTAVIM